MANYDINFQSDANELIVHRQNSPSNWAYDHYKGSALHANILDNGTLHITESRKTVAAYPPGSWVRVTPPRAEDAK